MSEFAGLSDHFIMRMHEFIRNEVQADALAGTRLIGLPARQRADRLFQEIQRRGLSCKPIEWPAHLADPSGDVTDWPLRTITN
jgi:hypothetical protein